MPGYPLTAPLSQSPETPKSRVTLRAVPVDVDLAAQVRLVACGQRDHPGRYSACLDVDPAVPGQQFQAVGSEAGRVVYDLFDKGARDLHDALSGPVRDPAALAFHGERLDPPRTTMQ